MQNARNDYMVQYLNMSRPNELASATPTRYDQFVAGWRLQGRAGEGSRGTVVAAIDTSNCLVAIKIINRRHSSEVDRISRQITTYQDMTRCLDGHHNVDYIQTLWDVLYENPTPGLRDQVFLVLTPLVEIDFYKLFCQWRADPISMRTAKEFASVCFHSCCLLCLPLTMSVLCMTISNLPTSACTGLTCHMLWFLTWTLLRTIVTVSIPPLVSRRSIRMEGPLGILHLSVKAHEIPAMAPLWTCGRRAALAWSSSSWVTDCKSDWTSIHTGIMLLSGHRTHRILKKYSVRNSITTIGCNI